MSAVPISSRLIIKLIDMEDLADYSQLRSMSPTSTQPEHFLT